MSQNALTQRRSSASESSSPATPSHAGERILYGQRINGVVRVTDRPADRPGRSYLIERGLEHDGYSALKALVADYTSQAGRARRDPDGDEPGPPHDRAGSGVSRASLTALRSRPARRLPLPDLRTLRVRAVGATAPHPTGPHLEGER